MATGAMLMTAEQLLAMPADGFRYELVRGELIRMSPASCKHGRIGELFGIYFGYYIESHGLGEAYLAETGFKLGENPDTVRAPDFAYISRERLRTSPEVDGFIPIPPDLCVEVFSQSDRWSEVEQKVYDWLDFGTRIVIVLNPKTLEARVYRSRAEVEILTEQSTLRLEDLLPGWSLELAKIFRPQRG